MKQHISLISLLVDDYDDAISFYAQKLGFLLVEDTVLGGLPRIPPTSPAANPQYS